MAFHRSALRLLLLCAVTTLSLACAAQDDHGSREKEALRRTQAALRQAQEQQSALAREKDDLASQRDKLDDAAKRAQSQLAGARSEAARLNATLARQAEEAVAAKSRDDAERRDLAARLEQQSQRLSEAQRTADERARANAALVALLQRATQSLAAAEKANGEMHALGLQMIERLRGHDLDADAPDAVLGFGQVKLENEAERLRDQLEATKLPGSARAPGAVR